MLNTAIDGLIVIDRWISKYMPTYANCQLVMKNGISLMSLAMVGLINGVHNDSLSFQPVFNWPRFWSSVVTFGTRIIMKCVAFLAEHAMPMYIYIYISSMYRYV